MARAILKGSPVSPGIAIGDLTILHGYRFYDRRRITPAEIPKELSDVDAASAKVQADIENTLHNYPQDLTEAKELLLVQLELSRDPKILNGTKARIKHRKICAAWALSETIEELVNLFKSMADSYLSERALDIKAIGKRLEDALGGIKSSGNTEKDTILAASELSPADIIELESANIKAALTEEGGATSHSAILARSLKIPAITGISGLFEKTRPGETVIADGFQGIAILGPDKKDLDLYQKSISRYNDFEQEANLTARQPAYTLDGKPISVLANLENVQQTKNIEITGAEGIGLYRTEYSFLSGNMPTEEMLTTEYQTVINYISPQKVVIRTLDTGADKLLSAQEALHEPNPALGLRGIRFCLQNLDLFKMQLRAILRASHIEPAAIMLPMVTNLQEVLDVKKILHDLSNELKQQNLPHAWPLPLGVMIETPAAVLICDSLAAQCDFLSIGTNDLLHYIMAIDRGNRHVAYLHEPLHPAFIRALKQVMDSAHNNGLKISICGELAADPFGIPLLLGLGVDALSASTRFVPTIKHFIRKLDFSNCAKLAALALNENNPYKTRKLLHGALEASLGTSMPFYPTPHPGR